MQIKNGNTDKPVTLHPTPGPSFLMLVAALLFLFLYYIKKDLTSSLVPAGILILFAIGFYIVFSKISIVLTEESIRYKNLFITREIPWEMIKRTFVKYHFRGKSSSYYWHFETTDQRSTKFSIRFFSRKNLSILANAIVEKCRAVEIGDEIHDMANGRFPWRIFW